MAPRSSSSLSELTTEAEVTREALTLTVGQLNEKVAESIDDLKTRLSPSHMKEELKGYVREERSQLINSIERSARENPLQAVAIGAAVIYPFWGILKSIPMPLLLIAGGVFLSKQKQEKISNVVTKNAPDLASSIDEFKTSIVTNVEAVTGTISDQVHSISNSANTTFDAATAALKETSSDTMETISESASALADKGAKIAQRSRTAFDTLMETNPLVVGGIAIAIGAFIAASIPTSEAENRLFGDRSEDLKDKTAAAVSQGVERAKDAAADIVGDITAAATREGLTGEGISKAIAGTAGAIKAVVGKGLDTALSNGAGTPLSSGPLPSNLA